MLSGISIISLMMVPIFQPVGFFFVFCAERQTQNGQGKKHGHKLLHKKSPLRGCARSSKKAAKGGQRNSSPEAEQEGGGRGRPTPEGMFRDVWNILAWTRIFQQRKRSP